MFQKLTDYLDSFLKMGIPGYDCIVLHNGVCVYRHRNGYSNLEKQIRMNGKERYHIYSCTKPITCAAALQLYEKGLLRLEDRLSDFLPEFENMYVKTQNGLKKAENSILIRHLLSMTAGFSYDVNHEKVRRIKEQTGGKCPTRRMVEWLAEEPLLFEPGTSFLYSLCHDVLAAVVEVAAGESFSNYVKKNIFEPLGMTHSAFHLSEDEKSSLAEQYRYRQEEGRAVNCGKGNEWEFGPEYDSGGAGCISTVEDMARFAEGLRTGGIILKPETVDRMAANVLTEAQRKELWMENYGYGLGVRCPVEEFDGSAASTACGIQENPPGYKEAGKGNMKRTDFGWYGAAGAYLAVDRVNQISVYYSQHLLDNPNGGMLLEIIEYVKDALNGSHQGFARYHGQGGGT